MYSFWKGLQSSVSNTFGGGKRSRTEDAQPAPSTSRVAVKRVKVDAIGDNEEEDIGAVAVSRLIANVDFESYDSALRSLTPGSMTLFAQEQRVLGVRAAAPSSRYAAPHKVAGRRAFQAALGANTAPALFMPPASSTPAPVASARLLGSSRGPEQRQQGGSEAATVRRAELAGVYSPTGSEAMPEASPEVARSPAATGPPSGPTACGSSGWEAPPPPPAVAAVEFAATVPISALRSIGALRRASLAARRASASYDSGRGAVDSPQSSSSAPHSTPAAPAPLPVSWGISDGAPPPASTPQPFSLHARFASGLRILDSVRKDSSSGRLGLPEAGAATFAQLPPWSVELEGLSAPAAAALARPLSSVASAAAGAAGEAEDVMGRPLVEEQQALEAPALASYGGAAPAPAALAVASAAPAPAPATAAARAPLPAAAPAPEDEDDGVIELLDSSSEEEEEEGESEGDLDALGSLGGDSAQAEGGDEEEGDDIPDHVWLDDARLTRRHYVVLARLLLRKKRGPGGKEELVIPPGWRADREVGRADSHFVKADKLQCLSDGGWLNDDVMDFAFSNFRLNIAPQIRQLLAAEAKAPGFVVPTGPILGRRGATRRARVYLIGCQFISSLVVKGKYDYARVRRWTKNGRLVLSETDVVIIPLHLLIHWGLAALDLPARTLHYYDSMALAKGATRDSTSAIEKLINESLPALLRWLEDESVDKGGEGARISTEGWKVCRWSSETVPQQHNGNDCGVFAVEFARCITEGRRFDFSQQDIPFMRRRLVVEIFEAGRAQRAAAAQEE